MKKIIKKIMTAVLVLVLISGVLAPAATFANTPSLRDLHPLSHEDLMEWAALIEEIAIYHDLGLVSLTPEAREIALSDFEYLFNMVMQTAPTQNIVERLTGSPIEFYFAVYHQIIYNSIPIISDTALIMGDRWETPSDDPLYMAADYLFSILLMLSHSVGHIGHMGPQWGSHFEDIFFGAAYIVNVWHDFIYTTPWGIFFRLHYAIFNTPSVLWFYGIDPAEFDFDTPLEEVLGAVNADNIETRIIEPGRIAYISIASFANNILFDGETLFPFYREIQGFEHLIIDLRGNPGGWMGSFPENFVRMLIDEEIGFTNTEFFMYSDSTAGFYVNPSCPHGGTLYGIFPAAEFVADRGMTLFNQEDLALLDYVAVWEVRYFPAANNIPFAGQIWLLVDEGSASASEMAAQMALNTGFATVVGHPTRGITGVTYTFAALPSTGIVFRIDIGYTADAHGRSFEEFGVVPEIEIRADQDALDVVIDLIGEAPEAGFFDTVARRYVDGAAFVPVRYVADAHGWGVTWDGPNNAAVLTDMYGIVWVLTVSTDNIFNVGGRLYMPLEMAIQMFS